MEEDIEYVQIVVLSEPHILGRSDFAFIRDKIHNEEVVGWKFLHTAASLVYKIAKFLQSDNAKCINFPKFGEFRTYHCNMRPSTEIFKIGV